MPPSEVDPRLNFVIDAENRASAKIDAADASMQRLNTTTARASQTYSRLTSQDLAQATEWFDRTYGSANKVTASTAEMAASAEVAGRRTALAAERMSGGLLMVARSGEVSARGIRSLLGGATDLAFAFGPEGAWLTAIAIAGTALSAFWDREQKNADKTAKEYQKVLDVIKKLSVGEQQATAATQQGIVDNLNKQIAKLQSERIERAAHGIRGDQFLESEIDELTKQRDAAQVAANFAKANADSEAQKRRLTQQAEDMKQDISDLEGRLATAKQELAEEKKTGVGPEEDPGKLASELAQKRAALATFYNEEHAFMGVNLDDEMQAINVEARRYAQGEARAAQLRRFNDLRQRELDLRRSINEALRAANTAAEAGIKPIANASRDSLDSIGALPTGKEIAAGARDQIAGESGTSRADNALIAAFSKLQKIRDDAHKKELQAEREHQRELENVIRGSIDGLVRARQDLGRQILRAALEPEIKALEGSAAHEFAIAAKDLVTQNYAGAAMHAAGGAALIAGAKLVDSIAGGGGGSGYSGGGGGGGGGTPGTFRPNDQGQGNGSFTLNLITKHPASPDVVQSIAYELNRSNVLKRPPIQIPPTAGLQPFQG